MHVTIVHVHVREECIDDFIDATRLNHEGSVKEPGNRRFDVLQDADVANHFVLYEAYIDAESAARHKEAEHYLDWRQTVADMMAGPRKGVLYEGLLPAG